MAGFEIKTLETMLKALTTLEAKGAVIYKFAKKIDEQEKEAETGKFIRDRWPKVVEKLPEQIPFLQENGDSVLNAVGLAFKDKEFKIGFKLAAQGGILENIITQLEQIPKEDLQHDSFSDRHIPEPITQIPGYTAPDRFNSYAHRHTRSWVNSLFSSLIEDVLTPIGQYYRAAKLRIQKGEGAAAIHFAHFDLGPEELAELCELAQAGFSEAIDHAKEHDRQDIVERLQEKHIKALVEGTHETSGKKPDRWIWAAETAEKYGRDKKTIQDIRRKGVNHLKFEFKRELNAWKRKIEEMNRRRISYDDESCLRRERMHNIRRPDNIASALIELIKKLPQEEMKAVKQEIYEFCDASYPANYLHDGLGIAVALGDFQEAARFGTRLLNNSRCSDGFWHKDVLGRLTGTMDAEVIGQVGEKEIKKYISALLGTGNSDHRYDATRIANKYGLSNWLMKEFEDRKEPYHAADIAISQGKKTKAKNLLIQAKQYERACEFTDDPVDKATLQLRIAEERIKHRIKCKDGFVGDRSRYNKEIALIQKGILPEDTEPTLEYRESVTDILITLFDGGEFSEGCLFIEATRIPISTSFDILVGNEAKEAAEKNQDFAACYHIARLCGTPEETEAYRMLAEQMEQTIPTKLEDFVYHRPKPAKVTEEINDNYDDVPF
ncbi:hypothetical protein KY315_00435 [Candidatus Woesearchaeota archaeon]|nr:hypothetical protein [Candidatus Woesearchaeota archaeon]